VRRRFSTTTIRSASGNRLGASCWAKAVKMERLQRKMNEKRERKLSADITNSIEKLDQK
jgi:hypothetical protein